MSGEVHEVPKGPDTGDTAGVEGASTCMKIGESLSKVILSCSSAKVSWFSLDKRYGSLDAE